VLISSLSAWILRLRPVVAFPARCIAKGNIGTASGIGGLLCHLVVALQLGLAAVGLR
jgi:hypothetical protein